MLEIFRAIIDIPAPFNMIVLIVLFGCTVGVIGAIATEIRKYGCHRMDLDFKRELVDRGFSSEEIVRIVSTEVAGSESPVVIGGNCYVGEQAAASS